MRGALTNHTCVVSEEKRKAREERRGVGRGRGKGCDEGMDIFAARVGS